jgi:hypothetical protein
VGSDVGVGGTDVAVAVASGLAFVGVAGTGVDDVARVDVGTDVDVGSRTTGSGVAVGRASWQPKPRNRPSRMRLASVVLLFVLIGLVVSPLGAASKSKKHTAHPSQTPLPAWWQHMSGAIVRRMNEKVKYVAQQKTAFLTGDLRYSGPL